MKTQRDNQTRGALVLHPTANRQMSLTEGAANITDLKAQVNLIQHVMREVMVEGEHYGTIPGCGDKKTLLKSGAEKLMLTFRLSNDVEIETVDSDGGHRESRVKVTLFSMSGQQLGTGVGSCSTMEGKYRFRVGPVELTNKPVPKTYWDLRKENPVRAQDTLGGKGFVAKKDDTGQWMIAKQGEKVEHDNPADYFNTVLKMAKKRALVDAVLTSTAASDIFTQDIEDDPTLYASIENPTMTPAHPEQQPATATTSHPDTGTQNDSPREPEVLPPETSGENPPADIPAALAARRIPFELDEENGIISAAPSFQDTAAREFLKTLGFKWDSKAKAWLKVV